MMASLAGLWIAGETIALSHDVSPSVVRCRTCWGHVVLLSVCVCVCVCACVRACVRVRVRVRVCMC